ncbi:MAG TPA: helix-turn-helix domain-containing protein [Steroidobacteraceae bacterium]
MSRRTIPQYFLYGEATQDVDERFLHVESIAERSRRHNWTIRPHAHRDLYHLLLVLKGGGIFHAEGAQHAFSANALINVPQSCVHGFDFKPGTDGWIVTASGILLSRIARDYDALQPVFAEASVIPIVGPVAPISSLFEALVDEFHGHLPARRAAAESWLTMIAVAVLRRKMELAPKPARPPTADAVLASKFRALVEANYRSQWGIADYARRLCISQERLRVACVRTTGSSPLALLNARRLLEAKRSLLYTNMSVALIAESCGFPDPAYFSRFFARSTGQSPRAYRLSRRAAVEED